METIYIALVSAPGWFASAIRQVIGIKYCHVVLSLDESFENAYSFNRRNPYIPWFAGFVKEDANKISRRFPTAQYKIARVRCTKEQKEQLRQKFSACYQKRLSYHYAVAGLPFILLNKPFYQKNRYTCSSFISKTLDEAGIHHFDKHFSLVTPRDFYEADLGEPVYEGLLSHYLTYFGSANKYELKVGA